MTKERDELLPYFNLVEDKNNWKMPIDAFVGPDANLSKIEEAIRFFTGSIPTVVKRYSGAERKFIGYHITAEGYYLAIGS